MKPYYECPSFNVCSANVCPLDPDIKLRKKITGEEKCRAYKTTRVKIGGKYPELLKFKGLTHKEWNGMKRWEGMDPHQQGEIRRRLSKTQKVAKKGHQGGSL